jgi:uncharacterized RDD family membrane protein YckC
LAFTYSNMDAAIGRLVQQWAWLENQVPPGHDPIGWLSQLSGVPFGTIDFVRRVRNESAHGQASADRLHGALRTADDLVNRVMQRTGAPAGAGAGPYPPWPGALAGGPATRYVLAGWSQRVAARLIDDVVVIGVALVAAAGLGASWAAAWFLAFVVAVGYRVVTEGSDRGATLGKRAVGIRVIGLRTSGPIGVRRAAVRTLMPLLIGLFSLGIGLWIDSLWMLRDKQRQTLHDKVVSTIVVVA